MNIILGIVTFSLNILEVLWSLPLDRSIIARFMAHLFNMGLKYSTILTHLSAIAFYHSVRGHEDPGNSFYFKNLMLGIKPNSAGERLILSINKSILYGIVGALSVVCSSSQEAILMKSVMLCMYYGYLRVGEALVSNLCSDHTLKSENIRLCRREGSVCIVYLKLDSYKHNNGNTFWLVLQREVNIELCPVVALHDYIKIRPKMSGIFFIMGSGQALGRLWFVQHQKQTLHHIDNSKYISHLVRVSGRTTDLALGGLSHEQIRLIGRWSSDAYHKYIHSSLIVLP